MGSDATTTTSWIVNPSWSRPEDWEPLIYDDAFYNEKLIFEADIEWLAAVGITFGCNPPENTLYCPTHSVTRGQMAAFLHRASPNWAPEV